jgi:hypothetical protein
MDKAYIDESSLQSEQIVVSVNHAHDFRFIIAFAKGRRFRFVVQLEKRELRIGDPQIESFFDLERLEFRRELELDLRVAIPQRTEESYLA